MSHKITPSPKTLVLSSYMSMRESRTTMYFLLKPWRMPFSLGILSEPSMPVRFTSIGAGLGDVEISIDMGRGRTVPSRTVLVLRRLRKPKMDVSLGGVVLEAVSLVPPESIF